MLFNYGFNGKIYKSLNGLLSAMKKDSGAVEFSAVKNGISKAYAADRKTVVAEYRFVPNGPNLTEITRVEQRAKNPVPRSHLKKGSRAYVNRASQITGAAPSVRLKARRKAVANAPAGYFPNPMIYVSDYDTLAKHIFRTLKAHGKATPQIIANAIDEWMLASGRAYHEVRH